MQGCTISDFLLEVVWFIRKILFVFFLRVVKCKNVIINRYIDIYGYEKYLDKSIHELR